MKNRNGEILLHESRYLTNRLCHLMIERLLQLADWEMTLIFTEMLPENTAGEHFPMKLDQVSEAV